MPMLILNSRSNSIVGSWQESSIMAEVRIMAENEVLFQKGSRTKYCRGVNDCVILLTYSVLGCCHSTVSHFNSVIARYGKAICLTFSWLTKVFTALQNIVEPNPSPMTDLVIKQPPSQSLRTGAAVCMSIGETDYFL